MPDASEFDSCVPDGPVQDNDMFLHEPTIKSLVESWLLEMYGKCEDYERTCIACRKWRAFRVLFE